MHTYTHIYTDSQPFICTCTHTHIQREPFQTKEKKAEGGSTLPGAKKDEKKKRKDDEEENDEFFHYKQ
jgi:hypothetical protein